LQASTWAKFVSYSLLPGLLFFSWSSFCLLLHGLDFSLFPPFFHQYQLQMGAGNIYLTKENKNIVLGIKNEMTNK
jgi:hypothetical protein